MSEAVRMKAYSEDLRQRIVSARLSGQRTCDVARVFGVSTSMVRRSLVRHRQGLSLAPGRSPGKAPRLRPEQEAAFIAMVEQKSDWTIEQLSVEWHRRSGVWLPRSTLHDHLQRLGGRFKKRAVSRSNAAR